MRDHPDPLDRLHATGLLDEGRAEDLDRVARLACRALGAPVALVSLVDVDRQYVVGQQGLDDRWAEASEADSFCREIVRSQEPLTTEGASARTPDSGDTVEPAVIARAGVPLRLADGTVLGSLCAIDHGPRSWSDDDLGILEDLAGAAVVSLQRRLDLVRRHEVETRLRASQARLRDLLEGVRAIVWECDARTWAFSFISRGVEEILGYPVRDWYDDDTLWESTLHPLDRRRVLQACSTCTDEGVDGVLEYRAIARDGSVVWLRDIIHPVIGPTGETTRLRGVMIDITERKQREQRARLLTSVLDSLGRGVVVTAGQAQVVYSNRAYRELLGLPEGDEPRPTRDLMADDAAREQIALIEEGLRRDERWAGRIRRRRADDGRLVPLDAEIARVRTSGGHDLDFAVVEDASLEVDREEHLRRTERMVGVAAVVQGFIREINDPLTVIRGFCDLLLDELERPPEDLDALRAIAGEAIRAGDMVDRVGRMTRRARADDRGSQVDPAAVAGHVLDLRRSALTARGLTIRFDSAPDLPAVPVAQGDLEQVLLALLYNVEEAAERGASRLEVRVDRDPRADGVVIEVGDDGPGIADPGPIFDPFHSTWGGSGLGLSLAASLVRGFGGRIDVDTVPGEGAVFRVFLPAARSEAGAPAALPDGRSVRVLVIEPRQHLRALVLGFLEQRGHQGTAVPDAAAVRAAVQSEPALVLASPGDPEAVLEALSSVGASAADLVWLGEAPEGRDERALGAPLDLARLAAILRRRAADQSSSSTSVST